MLTRILIILGLIALALWVLRKALGRPGADKASSSSDAKPAGGAKKKKDTPALDLIACGHCGLHLPRTEAIWRADQAFCCEDHARKSGPDQPQ
nr:hypothetical protein NCPCFENI_00916 [Cupriavidus sp.]